MSREQLVVDARAAGRSARQKLKWMEKHPERYNQRKKANMEAYLNMLIKFAKEEQKNTRSAKRASLRNRLKCLVVSILAHKGLSFNVKR